MPPGQRPGHSDGFAGDVVKLAFGSSATLVLTVATAPILSRLFAPAALGAAAIFTALSWILVSIACLCYDSAILLPEDDDEAASIVGLASMAAGMAGILCATACVSFQGPILRALHWQGVPYWPWLLAQATFFGGMSSALGYWQSRKRRFGGLSLARFGGSAVNSSVQLSEGALGNHTAAPLVHGSVSGSAATVFVLGAQLGRHDARQLLGGQRIKRIVAGALRYRKFPLLATWSALLNSISWQLPALLLGFFFNSSVVGFYALGFRMLQLPMAMGGNSVAQVFFQRAAKAKHEGQLPEVVRGVYDALLEFGLLPMAILGVAGPDIFSSILGSRWHEAGVYAQILAPWTLVWFMSQPLLSLFSVLEVLGLGLWMDTLIFVTRFASLAVGGLLGSARLAIALFSATGVLVYGYAAVAVMSRAGVKGSSILPWTVRRVFGVIPVCVALLILELLGVNKWVVVGVAAAFILAEWTLLFRRYRTGKMRIPQPARE